MTILTLQMSQKMQKRKMQIIVMPGFCGLLSLRRGRGYASSHLFLCSWAGIATARTLQRRGPTRSPSCAQLRA